MKRRLVLLLLLLVGGAIVNVAVAWGCARYLRVESIHRPARYIAKLADVRWLGMSREQLAPSDSYLWTQIEPIAKSTVVVYDGFLYHDRDDRPVGFSSLPTMRYFAARVSAGWPLLSLSGGVADRRVIAGIPVSDADTSIVSAVTGMPLLSGGTLTWCFTLAETPVFATAEYGRMFPLRPVWPGFAINTVFYAMVLWLLFAGPFALRRRRRIRRGLCPKCAYDLRGTTSEACTECGAAVRPNRGSMTAGSQ